jgi:glycosyltransferase involved in cell wall biosynthesis
MKQSPRFSILVPTRDRPATLRHTLATVVAQPGEDYEVVVADNCSGPETAAIVRELNVPNLRHVRSGEILPMAENWERGLSLCAGEYVTVLGDDDGLVIGALAMARKLLSLTQPEIISWHPHVYWWPDAIVPWLRNLLIMHMGSGTFDCDSREVLRDFYRSDVSYGMLPQIYAGFFHRSVIEEARQRFDAFFVPPDAAPDIVSSIVGLHITERYLYSMHPFSVRGNSGKSNGTAQWMRSLGTEQREAYFREERIGPERMIHKSLIPSANLQLIVASAMLKCKEVCFPHDDSLTVDLRKVLEQMIRDLNREPEAYEDNLRDVQAFAAKLGVKLGAADIPARTTAERKMAWGPSISAKKMISQLGVNCDLARAFNIADAARIIEAILPAEGFLEQPGVRSDMGEAL